MRYTLLLTLFTLLILCSKVEAYKTIGNPYEVYSNLKQGLVNNSKYGFDYSCVDINDKDSKYVFVIVKSLIRYEKIRSNVQVGIKYTCSDFFCSNGQICINIITFYPLYNHINFYDQVALDIIEGKNTTEERIKNLAYHQSLKILDTIRLKEYDSNCILTDTPHLCDNCIESIHNELKRKYKIYLFEYINSEYLYYYIPICSIERLIKTLNPFNNKLLIYY